ncbi:MAG TPA: hypothetical protein VK213_12510 [Bacteroidales bacterium]|nr:hypothetical protein [Bacteroidales bacterium]
MEKKSFPLGTVEDNRTVRILRILFGVACLATAAYWIIYSITQSRYDWSLLVSILFLIAFGGYQVWAGLGKAFRYIEINPTSITLRKSSLRKPEIMNATEISGIEILPLSIIFRKGEGEKTILRLGQVHYETNENIIDMLISFAERNNISYEIKADEL